ncbi:hypothetical protein niasHT_015505 [Heterodera trifolii]|uniref:DMAP1-binding domain-containing protein n=1 Tax=Heterodera trifolii TaxID=157864 RepID=A0ABD2L096_9BILA
MPSLNEVDVCQLPDEIRLKLAQLDLELSEGDLTEKGYEKRRQLLLKPILERQQNNRMAQTSASGANPRNVGTIERKRHRRGARDQLRYHSEIRQEAVHLALSEWGHGGAAKKTMGKGRFQPIMRRHTSRVSCAAVAAAVAATQNGKSVGEEAEETADSSSDDEEEEKKTVDSGTAEENDGNGREGAKGQKMGNGDEANANCVDGRRGRMAEEAIKKRSEAEQLNRHDLPAAANASLSVGSAAAGGKDGLDKRDGQQQQTLPAERTDSGRPTNGNGGENCAKMRQKHRQPSKVVPNNNNAASSSNECCPPHPMANRTSVLVLEDRPLPPLPPVTDDEEEDEIGDGTTAVYVNSTGDSGIGGSSKAPQDYANTNIPVQPTRVSRKIQQVLQSLQRPRKKPLHEYYNDDDAELEALANTVDPNAPQSNGQLIVPARGDFPSASTSGASAPPPLPRSIDSVLYKWANTQPKSVAAVQLDSGGKATATLTYSKLLSRANKVAYHLLTRQVTVNTGGVKERVHLCLPDDRVALVFPNSEPIAFLVAFYGCLLAGVVPVPIEVPMPKRDVAGLQQFGFLLGSCGAHVALTSESCMKMLPKAGSVSSASTAPSGSASAPFGSAAFSSTALLHSPSSTFASSNAFPSSTTGSTGSGSSSGAQRDHNAFIHHSPPQNPNDVTDFKGWPRLHWVVTEHLGKPSRDWTLPSLVADDHPAYIEYTFDREGSIKGVEWSRQAMLAHSRAIGLAAGFKEDETMVCVVDFRREVGLWFAVIGAILHGMRVHFVPYSLMKVNPTAWLSQVTRHSAQHAVAKSRDLHWSLMAIGDHSQQIQLKSLRCLLVADGANPWSLSSCDQFIATFKSHGIWPGALCPCAGSAETGIVAMRRPSHPEQVAVARNGGGTTTTNCSTSGRGVLSMLALSHCVVRVDQENSLTSLTLQDTGQVIPGGMAVVVKLCGAPRLCRADEVGEICLHAPSAAVCYHGLKGLSQNTFAVLPLGSDDKPIGPLEYVRSGLAGFLGPEGLIFTVGCKQSLLHVSGRVHSADDLIATVLAVEPMKFVYRGRIAVFSVSVLRDERVCIVCEQRAEISEEEAFNWMVRVLQACESIHQLGIYCLALVPPNHLPKTSLGGIYVTETRRRFLDGCLHPSTLLMCPQNCVLNLPKPREPPAEVGPAAMFVGNIVQGVRIAGAQGKELPSSANECVNFAEILRYRAQHSPEHVLYSLLNSRGVETDALTSSQLLKRAERIAALLTEKGRLNAGDHVALIFPPGLDLVAAVFACFFASLVPICIRPPSVHNFHSSMLTVRMIIDVSKAVALLSNGTLIKLLRSKELSHRVNAKAWPTILDIEDAPSLSVARSKARKAGSSTAAVEPSIARRPDDIFYLDFAVSTTGQLSGIVVTAVGAAKQCKSLKMACELYPSRTVTVCLDPYSGLGFTLWCLCSVYSGHQSILIPPFELEQNPLVWMQTLSQHRSRDTFCTYSVLELCLKELAAQVGQLREKSVSLSSLRNCVVVAEERPRVQLCNAFVKVFAPLGLSPRAVSTSFGCRVNPAVGMQGAASPDPSVVYVDARALRNDRVTLVEKGAPHSIALMESGKLLPGVKVVIANPKTLGQCADTHLGEIWVSSGHNASGFFSLFSEEAHLQTNHFNAKLKTGDTNTAFARTGYLGFLRQTQAITADGELHDAIFVVGALEEALMLRGMRFHPVDIELSVSRAHRRIDESCVFTWTHLLVVVAETHAPEAEALDLVPAITSALLEDHHLIVGVVVVLDPGTIPINSRGEKQRMHLRELFLKDQLDPIYVAYNM